MISTAVILSARREKDSEVPYPLIPLDGDMCILDRTISTLKDFGIKKIVLIVGYRAKLFEKYQNQGIIIQKNENYRFTGSMSSLAIAAKYIDGDFLLVESDVICEKHIYEALINTNYKNCLTIVSESGSGDEALVEIDDDTVLKISKDPHQLNSIDGEMIGISKISIETLRKMLLKYNHNTNPSLNYEYLFLDSTNLHEHKFIKYNDIVWCDVDNAIDFIKLKNDIFPKLRKKENPFDILNIQEHLRDIFPNEDLTQELEVSFIGGMTNRNYRVTLKGSGYVLRIPGQGTEGMILRSNESKNSYISNRLGISPHIEYLNPGTGIKLSKFIPDAETLNRATIQRCENLAQIATILKVLHNSEVRLNNEFNVFHEIVKYEQLLNKVGGKMYAGYSEIRSQIFGLEDRLNSLGVQIKPCHNDLVAENFIKSSEGKIYLIDWEYSGMNDPMWDFGALFLESDFNEDSKTYILQKYLKSEDISDAIWAKIKIYQILADILWSIWTVIKEIHGDNFGSYGIDRYNRAKKNLFELNNLRSKYGK